MPFVSTLWDSSSSSGHFSCLGAAGRVGGRGSAEGAAGEGREVSPASAREKGLETSALGCHRDAPPLPSRPLCRTTPGVVFWGINQSHLPPVHGWGNRGTVVKDLGGRSPCCNTSGVRAPSPNPPQNHRFRLQKREGSWLHAASQAVSPPPIPMKRALSSPWGSKTPKAVDLSPAASRGQTPAAHILLQKRCAQGGLHGARRRALSPPKPPPPPRPRNSSRLHHRGWAALFIKLNYSLGEGRETKNPSFSQL